jgi:hypothetical protein
MVAERQEALARSQNGIMKISSIPPFWVRNREERGGTPYYDSYYSPVGSKTLLA